MNNPLLTVIIPCYNESRFVSVMVEKVLKSQLNKEVFVIDGGSTDNTLDILKELQAKYPELIVLHNPARYVSQAINIGLKQSRGKYIARMDVHARYPENYLETCLTQMEIHECDNIGGYVTFKGFSRTGQSIAAALSSAWGIGYKINDTFRFDHFTDTVHFGFWHKKTFEEYGYFDEELLRDQDEELNYRITQRGGRIFKTASIVTDLYVRESFILLLSQYFQYGLFKPLVIHKIGQIIKFRHLVPSLFLLYLLFIPYLWPQYGVISLYPLSIYILLSLYFAFNQTTSILIKLLTFLSFPIIHISYGLGFIFGALNLIFIRPFKRKK